MSLGIHGLVRFWADRPLALKGLVVIALPLAILLGALASLSLASHAEVQAEEDVRRAFAIQRDIYQVHALLAEAAAGVRGYALTGQVRFLEPYRKAEGRLPGTMARLEGQIRDEVVRQGFERIKAAVGRKRDGLASIVRLSSSPSRERSQAVLERALLDNKAVLDGMRRDIDAIQSRERILLEQRQARVDEVRKGFLWLTAVSGVVGLLGALLAVYLFSTGIVRRVRMLEGNAERLARGEPLSDLAGDADEIGALSKRLAEASALLRAREQALRESEERFRFVIEGVRDYGIFALNVDGTVATWNPGAERIKGWRADEILGRHFSRFYPEDRRNHLPAQMLERARTDGSAEDEGWRLRKDGSRLWANVVITALRDENGNLRGFAKVTRDITERRQAEEALQRAREEAVAANLAKSEFLSRTSHELRTPISAILGFGQLLELDDATLAPRQRAAVTQIMKAGRHLLALINELLDLSSIEAGRSDLVLESIPMDKLLDEVHMLATPIVAAAGLEFQLEGAGQGLVARADRRRVVQVLLNLISNAAKYHGSGTVIRMACSRGDGHIRLEVADDGEGIAERDVARLFTPFDRLDRQKSSKMEGTGLGLALSKQLVESMHGDMGFEARSPGACFWFTLPEATSCPSSEHQPRTDRLA